MHHFLWSGSDASGPIQRISKLNVATVSFLTAVWSMMSMFQYIEKLSVRSCKGDEKVECSTHFLRFATQHGVATIHRLNCKLNVDPTLRNSKRGMDGAWSSACLVLLAPEDGGRGLTRQS